MNYKEWLDSGPKFINHVDVVISGDHAAIAAETDLGGVTTLHTNNEFGLGKPGDQIQLGLLIAKKLEVPLEVKDASGQAYDSDEIELFIC